MGSKQGVIAQYKPGYNRGGVEDAHRCHISVGSEGCAEVHPSSPNELPARGCESAAVERASLPFRLRLIPLSFAHVLLN